MPHYIIPTGIDFGISDAGITVATLVYKYPDYAHPGHNFAGVERFTFDARTGLIVDRLSLKSKGVVCGITAWVYMGVPKVVFYEDEMMDDKCVEAVAVRLEEEDDED